MATTTGCQIALGVLVKQWFASPEAGFTVPIAEANIKDYSTTPTESSSSPNWIIIRAVATRPDSEVFDHTDLPARFAITLFSRVDKTEASREAAERWINDAEEMLIKKLFEVGATDDWNEIAIVGSPRRDAHRMFHGSHRTSDVTIDVDKIN
jgi:hypothetical protein